MSTTLPKKYVSSSSSSSDDEILLQTLRKEQEHLEQQQQPEEAEGLENREEEVKEKVLDWLEQGPDFSDSSDDEDLMFASILNRSPRKMPTILYQLTFLSAIGGFLFGYDTGVVSGAMVLIKQEFNLGTFWHELIVSITVGSAFMFSLIGGILSDTYGRKKVILAGSVTFTIGSFVLGMASGKYMLLFGRFIVGIGIGLSSVTVPVYIAESCPADKRGSFVTLNNVFITGGQFAAGLICGLLSTATEGWRYMLGLAAIPAVIQFFGFARMPESPRYLVQKGRYEEAVQVLSKIRNPYENVHEELEEIKIATLRDSTSDPENTKNFAQIFRHATLRRALFMGCALQFFQQVSGINTVMYYSATIITMAGVGTASSAIWLASITSFVNFACTFIGLALVDKIGRRTLLLASLGGVILSLLFMSGSFALISKNSPDSLNFNPKHQQENMLNSNCDIAKNCYECLQIENCGFCDFETSNKGGYCQPNSFQKNCTSSIDEEKVWANVSCPSSYSFLPIIGLCLYLLFFAPGMGPLPWTINAEIYPNWSRSFCTGVATSVNWSSNLLVSITFLTIIDLMGTSGAFLFYMFLSVLGFALFYFKLPETRGLSLEETEILFQPGYHRTGSNSSVRYSQVANLEHD